MNVSLLSNPSHDPQHIKLLKYINKLFRLSWWPFIKSNGRLRFSRRFYLYMESGAKIIGSGSLTAGAIRKIDRHSMNLGMVTIRRGGVLKLEGDVYIGEGTVIIIHPEAELTIGHGSYITGDSRIEVKKHLSIGDNCAISWDVIILDDNHHQHNQQKAEPEHTIIGDNVWIGADVTILKGAHVGSGSVIAAKALVKSVVPPNVLCGGIPAKIIKESVKWQK